MNELLNYYESIDGLSICKHEEFIDWQEIEGITYQFSYNHENNVLKVVRID